MPTFNHGDTIASRAGNTYKILSPLGEGITAEVYLAQRVTGGAADERVALKVLREGLTDKIEENFRNEADTLSRLRDAAKTHDPRVVDFVPRIIENASLREYAQTRFIAFEFVSAPALDRLLNEKGPLDEVPALTIATQVLGILDVLHTDLRKSYTDFQFQNIRWDEATQQVKVIDWNHVSLAMPPGETPPGAADDLARMAAYLYQMVTGAGARLSGESLRQLEQRGGQPWTKLSLGAQLLIARGLHLNPQRRYTTAADFRRAVDAHLALWNGDARDLQVEVMSAIGPIEAASAAAQPNDPVDIEHAQVLVDMLARREPDDPRIKRSRTALADIVGEISPAWAAAEQDYKRGAYQEAAATWEEEARARGRVALRRWVMAAQTGTALGRAAYNGPDVRPVLEDALKEMELANWESAVKLLRELASRHHATPLQGLLAEAEAHVTFDRARAAEGAGNWDTAARAYEHLLTLLPTIPYADAVREEFGWDTQALRRDTDRSANQAAAGTLATQTRREVESQLDDDFDTGLKLMIQKLQEQPDNPGLVALAEVADTRPPQQALNLLETVRLWAALSPEQAERLRERYWAATDRRLVELAVEAIERRDVRAVTATLDQLHAPPPSSLQDQLERWYSDAIKVAALPVAATLAGALGRWGTPDAAQKRQAEVVELRQKIITDAQQWQANLIQRIQELRDQRQYNDVERLLNEAAAYFADDEVFLNRLNSLRPEVEFERLLTTAHQQLEAGSLPTLALARDTLASASRLPSPVDSDAQERREQQLRQLSDALNQTEARLLGERYLASAEEWLQRQPPGYNSATRDLTEAESRLGELNDPTLRKRLQDVRSLLNARVHNERYQLFRQWLEQGENALADQNAPTAVLMATIAGNYRKLLPAAATNLEPFDRRLTQLRANAAEAQAADDRRQRELWPNDSRGTPVAPPPTVLDQVLRWAPLALAALALLLLIVLLAGGGRQNAAARALPTEVTALRTEVQALSSAVASGQAANAGGSLAPLATATTVVAVSTPIPTPLAPAPTPTATPSATSTISPTSTPLDVGIAIVSPSVVETDTSTFFDLPDLGLTAPAGWKFDLSQPALFLRDPDGNQWQLLYGTGDGLDSPLMTQEMSSSPEGTEADAIQISWRGVPGAPQPPGVYTLVIKATNSDTGEQRVSMGILFTVQAPPFRVKSLANRHLRKQPQWAQSAWSDTTFPPDQEFDLVGKTSAPCTSGCGWEGADQAVMLLVRPLGQRQTYWLGDYDSDQFGTPELAAALATLRPVP